MRNIQEYFGRRMRLCGGGYRCGFCIGTGDYKLFVKYGKYSIIGVLLFVRYFSVFAYAVLSVCVEKNIETYSDYLNNFFGYNIRKIVEIITLLLQYPQYAL